MRIVVLSPEGDRADEIPVLVALLAAGLTRYHVRKPAWSNEKMKAWLEQVPAEARTRLVLHSCHELVDTEVLLGRHWRDLPSTPAQPGLGFTSRACHDLASVRSALGVYSAVFYSPVFPSLSKPGYGGEATLGALPEILRARTERERTTEVIALGGVTPERVASCAAWGFDGVAVIGAVWQSSHPVKAFEALLAAAKGEVPCAA